MSKKLISVILACLLVLTLFAGCGNNAEKKEDGTQTKDGDKGEQVTIPFAETLPNEARTELLKEMVSEFEEQNPNIKVEFQTIPVDQSKDKLLTMAAGKALPDVFELNDSWLGSLGVGGHLESLEPYIENWENKDGLVDSVLTLGRSLDDTAYWIPYGFYGTAVYYNTEMLEATGMEAPTTTDEFYEVAKAMTNKDEGKYGYAFRGGPYGGTHAIMWMLSHVGSPDFFDENGECVFDTPEGIEGLKKYAALYKDTAPTDSTSWGFRECVTGFTTGVTGLVIQSNEVVQICDEKMGEGKFDTAMLPVGTSGKTYDTSGQAGYAMSAHSKHKEEAWKLLSFLNSPEQNMKFTKATGFTPIYKEAENDPAFSEGPAGVYLEQILSDKVEFAKIPSYLPEWSDFIADYSTSELQKMIMGEQSV